MNLREGGFEQNQARAPTLVPAGSSDMAQGEKRGRAPTASEWQFVEDEEFIRNVSQAGRVAPGAPSVMSCAFVLLAVLIVGVCIAEAQLHRYDGKCVVCTPRLK